MSGKERLRRRFESSTFTARATEEEELPLAPLPPELAEGENPEPGRQTAIVLLPVGDVEESTIKAVIPEVSATFGREVVLKKGLPVPKYAYNPSRAQYHSAAILKRVESAREQGWDSAVGIVDADLFVPEVPFIFGEADRSTRSAILSLTRLRPDIGSPESRREALHRRLLSELIHQIGLIRGLAHCPNNRCVMFQSTTVQETDKKGVQFCANCRKRLNLET